MNVQDRRGYLVPQMLFNSPEFIAFCLLVYVLYLVLPFRLQNYMLLIASYVFYGWWDCRFLFLVALSTTIDFWVGLMIETGRLRPRDWILPALFLTISAVVFLGLDPGSVAAFPAWRTSRSWRTHTRASDRMVVRGNSGIYCLDILSVLVLRTDGRAGAPNLLSDGQPRHPTRLAWRI